MKTQAVTFAAMTDLHLDIMHDGMMPDRCFSGCSQKGGCRFYHSVRRFFVPQRYLYLSV